VPFPRTFATAAEGIDGCVTADDPTVLILMDVLSRDLDRGCRVWVDVTGLTYDRTGRPTRDGRVARADNPVWQHQLMGYLTSGAATMLVRPSTGLSPASATSVAHWPVIQSAEGFRLLRPTR
jgi:alpha-1,2-mannosyltransferase